MEKDSIEFDSRSGILAVTQGNGWLVKDV